MDADLPVPSELEASLPDTWPLSERGLKALQAAKRHVYSRMGLYAGVPMVCRGDKCPVRETCPLYAEGMAPTGERCPIEISLIMAKLQGYSEQLGLEDGRSLIDLSQLKDLIDIEILLHRCDQLLASDGTPIQYVVVGVSQTGQPLRKPEIHKAIEIKERLLKRKSQILHDLNSTRKDLADVGGRGFKDLSEYAAFIMGRLQDQTIIDADYEAADVSEEGE